jgi:hypothetical protein
MTFGDRPPGPERGLRRLATRVPGTRSRRTAPPELPAGAPPAGEATVTPTTSPPRPDPVLRWKNPSQAPAGDFAPCAVPNAQLRVHSIPGHGDTWDAISTFSLSYDGYAYWDDVSELATRSIRRWTRNRTLPGSIDELRACLFYEQRRWHHFGEEPNGRGAQYVTALLDSLRNLVATRTVAASPHPGQRPAPEIRFSVKSSGGVRSFLDDDAGYLAWASRHADGFVVNADRTLSPNSLMLHRATCASIVGPAGSGRTRTANYRKVCGSNLDTLVNWCRTDIGTEPGRCRHCHPWP